MRGGSGTTRGHQRQRHREGAARGGSIAASGHQRCEGSSSDALGAGSLWRRMAKKRQAAASGPQVPKYLPNTAIVLPIGVWLLCFALMMAASSTSGWSEMIGPLVWAGTTCALVCAVACVFLSSGKEEAEPHEPASPTLEAVLGRLS